ncbi:MAG TPA: MG2 domain-containing protein, partial [Rheinheimera sp.]|nr:MG2 domain-containing protein [Rheinheimera sp.]
KGLTSRSSFTLANEYRSVVEAPAFPKEARVVGEGNMLTLSGEQKLQLLSRGVSGIKVRLHKLLPEQLNHLISQTNGDISKPYFNSYQFDESNISSAFEQTFALAERHPKAANYLALSLSSYLKQAGMGVFFVELSAWDPARPKAYGEQLDKRLVLVTDLGLLVKHNSDSSQQVFVMSTATGKPVAGAKVELLGKNGVAVLSGNTDAQGSVKLGKTNGFERERAPVVYKVSYSANGLSDSSFIPFDRYSRQLDYSKFNTHGRYQDDENAKALNAFVFTDRGIYRPGEQVELATIIRHNDLSLAAGALPLKVQVSGPRGSTFWQQNFTLAGRGMHTFTIPTQAHSDTGEYHASISLLDKKGNASRHLGSVSFAVEEFEPDTLKITNRFNQQAKGWLSPQELVAQVQLDNLFGTPAQQRKVSARFELIPSSFSFATLPDYQFLTPKDDSIRHSRISQSLDEQQTNADGSASFTLPLQQYSAGSYRLVFSSEGFDGDGGDSVQSSLSALLSPLSTLVGVKADGELNYLKKQQQRTLQFIAVSNELQQVALSALNIKLVEKRAQSSLVKQRDGTYQYQSIVHDVLLSETAFSISADGTAYSLPTAEAGDFELQLYQADTLLGQLNFSVVAAGNISAMLEQNAALSVKLDKADYKAGDWIELNITAPYTGSGLISIESDKVHAFSWFNSNTTSSIQRIRLPEGIEGNAYINVSYVRSSDSDALFISPLSYAVVPFNIDRSKRQLDISLILPKEVRPGKAFSISYKTDREADLLLYGVDEGILQVADYQLPDPLSHFLQKRALQVRSMQMLDLILPEFSALQRQLAGVGGDVERIELTGSRLMMDKNLNPFARRADQPGVFWLGKVAAGTTLQSAEVKVPASFSGNLKVMAVAVSDEALAASSKDVIVRGPFVLTPEVLPSAAPGDEFDVSVTVANGVSGSGANAPVTVELSVPSGLTVLGDTERTVSIAENGEQNLRFRLKAGAEPGEQSIRFSARYQQGELIEQSSR